ncbi:MAG: DUF4386 domain-containing protein [Rhodanobacteraceae bacterium]
MTTLNKNARIVGGWYLLLILVGPLNLIYIPTKLFVHGDAAATAANIAAHQTLFQVGIAGELAGAVVLIFLTLAFYRLFEDIDRYQAMLLVITGGVVPAAISFAGTASDSATLMLVRGADYLNVFSEPQRDALAYFFTRVSLQVTVCSELLWGIWLFPMAILILKSRWFPRFLGYWLIVNGIAYLVMCYAGLFMPAQYNTVSNYAFPFELGEVAFTLWLLIMGAREPGPAAATT